jgi:hypothetical protein
VKKVGWQIAATLSASIASFRQNKQPLRITAMATETWIVYKTESMSDRVGEERMLMPRQSLTDILEKNWSE